MRLERRDSSQFPPGTPRFGIAKDGGLFLRQAEHPWQATVMPDFGENFAEAAHKRDFLNRPFSPPRASNDEFNKRQFSPSESLRLHRGFYNGMPHIRLLHLG